MLGHKLPRSAALTLTLSQGERGPNTHTALTLALSRRERGPGALTLHFELRVDRVVLAAGRSG